MPAFETVQRLEAVLAQVPPFRQDFARSLISQAQRKALSEKQMFWVNKILGEALNPPAAVEVTQIGDLSGIKALFDRARAHLKFPAVTLNVPAVTGLSIRINVAGPSAKLPGTLNVVNSERNEATGRRDWYGRVKLDGSYEPGQKASEIATAVTARLVEFAANPARVAAEYGKLNGVCCFCGLTLGPRPGSPKASATALKSVRVGYGKTCAENFGLPWGELE